MHRFFALLPLAALCAGCPVLQDTDTPVEPIHSLSPRTRSHYWLYVPSTYRSDRDWPLVITLHGTHGWDGYKAQIDEWRALAEEEGFIVAAPKLKSVQGILPVPEGWRQDDLQEDEQRILATLEDVALQYRIDKKAVLLTGFSAGGYPLYYTITRNPGRFTCMVARSCNVKLSMLEQAPVDDQVRAVPGMIFWGKSDPKPIRDESWMAFRHFRENGWKVERDVFEGGHLRRPKPAWAFFEKTIDPRHR